MSADEEELALLLESGTSDPDVGAGPPSPLSEDGETPEVRQRGRRLGRNDGASPRKCRALVDEGASESAEASLDNFWHRAGWLVFLLFCQSSSSFILERFDFLIKSHPIVIYFLTMLVGAGGNAGGQSTVLIVRRLALAAAKIGKGRNDSSLSVRRIVGPEILVGAKLSLVLFVASFLRCTVFKVRGLECLAICLSMLAIVFTSTAIGAALPLLLSKLGMDPAHAGATIQVIMDVSGVTLTCVISCAVLGATPNIELMTNSTTTTSIAAFRAQSQGIVEVIKMRTPITSFGSGVSSEISAR
eukprot:TRINITY_DN41523_c0_g1_i1.p1 TRINITY_DN41523_c0_g1~~TRINITY_DN41523_c0_g1_i1.p1  ORF type:complete len:301 (+),score=40.86 TRINITY_DN41523_c0_g1_i1:231-1133(+)